MIADSFSIDVYCVYLNLPPAEESCDDSEGNRSMSPESTAGFSASSRVAPRPSRNPGYVLPRLIWMALGPGIMMMLSVLKLESRTSQPGAIDAGFLAVAIGILLIRWGTWIAGDKRDSFGGRTGLKGLFGFTGLVIAVASAVWILTNLVAKQQMVS